MSKIIKYYADIGCIYQGDDLIDSVYSDHYNWNIKYGLIGILKLKIDTEKRTKKEVFFKQIFKPCINTFARNFIYDIVSGKNGGDDCKDILKIFREYRDADLIIGWNSRDFDIPIIIHNLKYSEKRKKHYLEKINEKDRDLLDLCVLRDISVKGGLSEVVKRLNIEHNFPYKNTPEYGNDEMCFLTGFDRDTNIYNNNLKIIKQRNEFDVRILPLLEEKLGYLYTPRIIQDKFHKKWQ